MAYLFHLLFVYSILGSGKLIVHVIIITKVTMDPAASKDWLLKCNMLLYYCHKAKKADNFWYME